ncbi:MAG TPA: choice-of-anchor E domain-containing protein [Leptolyngbyaceae cyanobacterium]
MVTKSLARVLQVAGIAATVSVISLAVAPQAHAALLFTSSASFTKQPTDLEPSNPDLKLTLSKYQPSAKENVNKVVITLESEIESSGSVTNKSSRKRDFTIVSQLGEFIVSPNDGAPSALGIFNLFSASPELVSQAFTLNKDETGKFGPFVKSDKNSQTFENNSDIQQFLGVGNFSFSPSALVNAKFTGSGNNNFQINTLASVKLTVDYYGEPIVSNPPRVPEASTTLGIIGLAGAAFVSKKLGAWQKSVG